MYFIFIRHCFKYLVHSTFVSNLASLIYCCDERASFWHFIIVVVMSRRVSLIEGKLKLFETNCCCNDLIFRNQINGLGVFWETCHPGKHKKVNVEIREFIWNFVFSFSYVVSLDNFATPVVCILSGYLQQALGPKIVSLTEFFLSIIRTQKCWLLCKTYDDDEDRSENFKLGSWNVPLSPSICILSCRLVRYLMTVT